MKETDIHRLMLAYGALPLMEIIKELEAVEKYEECHMLKSAVDSFMNKYDLSFLAEKRLKTVEEYTQYYENLKKGCGKIAKSNIEYYIAECKEKLKL